MKVSRTPVKKEKVSVKLIDLNNANCESLLGDNRELMRHSNGSLHAAIIETNDDRPTMGLFGFSEPDKEFVRLVSPVSSKGSLGDSKPATDSNQNGVYIAYVEANEEGKAGYVAHVPDVFQDPTHFTVHGPLTPFGKSIQNSFFQASRGYNSVVYGWRDSDTGALYIGISKDGINFPPAKLLVTDPGIVNGPVTGVFADYAFMTYETSNPEFAPQNNAPGGGAENYFAFCETGDGGETWSKPAALIADTNDLPMASAYTIDAKNDLHRSEIPLTAAGAQLSSLQGLVWESPSNNVDKRVFALTSVKPSIARGGEEWQGKEGNGIGVLAWKWVAVGGKWNVVLTNRGLFRRGLPSEKPYAGRIGNQFKYCALPGTSVRVVAYVDKAPSGSKLQDQVVLLVSINMGNSFDYEATFTAEELKLEPEAQIVITNSSCTHADEQGDLWQDLLLGDLNQPGNIYHAMLPVGINVQEMDLTQSW